MNAHDFIYDGKKLSDMGYQLCSFNGASDEVITNGSQITWNTVSTLRGAKWERVSSVYESCISTTFDICKRLCDSDDLLMTADDERELMRWLNRKQFHEFQFVDGDYAGYLFDCSFNIGKIQSGGRTVGLELTMTTNRPFGYIKRSETYQSNSSGVNISVDMDDEGYIYFDEISFECSSAGDLEITSADADYKSVIKNCSDGEIITMRYPVITSSVQSHDLPNDFNWVFPYYVSEYGKANNNIKTSLPCTIRISHKSAVKINI